MADNIFDDVDAILSEDMTEEDKNFNESELQDIMSEIEDLEKEFVAEEAPGMSLQEKIDAELAAEMADIVEDVKVKSEVVPEVKPLAFDKPVTTAKSEVAFSAQGTMALSLDFKVGSESAKLWIDPVKGLMVTVSGVELCINEDSGCTVSMENGMKFTIPLSSPEKSLKKKAA